MKKSGLKLFILLLAVIFVLTSFTGCGGGKGKQELSTIMGTSGLTGSWYPVGSAIASVVRKHTDVVVTIQATGGSTENLRMMKSGEFGMGLVNAAMAYYAYHGVEAFKDDAYKGMTIVANLYPTVVQVIVMKNSPIKSYADLKGKKFSPGAPGSGDEVAFTEILGAYGIARKDLDWRPLTHTERSMSFKDRIIDAAGFFTSVPSGPILEVASMNELRLIGISDKKEEFFKRFPYYIPWVIPANTYNGETSDIETIGAGTFICADAKVSNELIYKYLKGMFTELEPIQNVHGMTKFIKFESALDGIGDIPVHPGAIKYFKETGLIKK
jgi:TRAP transporter TAXI family solute receptor